MRRRRCVRVAIPAQSWPSIDVAPRNPYLRRQSVRTTTFIDLLTVAHRLDTAMKRALTSPDPDELADNSLHASKRCKPHVSNASSTASTVHSSIAGRIHRRLYKRHLTRSTAPQSRNRLSGQLAVRDPSSSRPTTVKGATSSRCLRRQRPALPL